MIAMLAALAGCTPAEPRATRTAVDLPLSVLADTGAGLTLPAAPWPAGGRPTAARATLTQVAPSRMALEATLPEATPARPEAAPSDERGGGLAFDDDLQPPIPRGSTPLTLPRARSGWVELDVRVDELGEVTDAEWFAASSDDPAATQAAIAAAFAMRFHPALQRGVPVAVWARQRFEFGAARDRR